MAEEQTTSQPEQQENFVLPPGISLDEYLGILEQETQARIEAARFEEQAGSERRRANGLEARLNVALDDNAGLRLGITSRDNTIREVRADLTDANDQLALANNQIKAANERADAVEAKARKLEAQSFLDQGVIGLQKEEINKKDQALLNKDEQIRQAQARAKDADGRYRSFRELVLAGLVIQLLLAFMLFWLMWQSPWLFWPNCQKPAATLPQTPAQYLPTLVSGSQLTATPVASTGVLSATSGGLQASMPAQAAGGTNQAVGDKGSLAFNGQLNNAGTINIGQSAATLPQTVTIALDPALTSLLTDTFQSEIDELKRGFNSALLDVNSQLWYQQGRLDNLEQNPPKDLDGLTINSFPVGWGEQVLVVPDSDHGGSIYFNRSPDTDQWRSRIDYNDNHAAFMVGKPGVEAKFGIYYISQLHHDPISCDGGFIDSIALSAELVGQPENVENGCS